MTDRDDVTIHQPATASARIGHQLASWLTADMLALCDLLDVTEPDVLHLAEVSTAAKKLMESLAAALGTTGTD